MDPFALNWQALLVPGMPVLETVLRATVVYFLMLAVLRLIPNRHMGTIGVADLLVVVLMVGAVQNAMTNGYRSLTDGAILVVTITAWSHAINWFGFHVSWFQRLMRPPPLPLVLRGRMLHPNMRQELITEDELMTQLRHQGIDDLAHVRKAYMEGDGRISVVVYRNYATASSSGTQHTQPAGENDS